MFAEVRMPREVVILSVLKNKHPTLFQQSFLKYQVRNRGQVLQCIRWVVKDKVILLLTGFDEAEDIAAERQTDFISQLFYTLTDEAVVVAIQFNADHAATAS